MEHNRTLAVGVILMLSVGCASTNKTPAEPSKSEQSKTKTPPGSSIDGNFPADSAFAKIKLGMTQGQVHEILGQPTDTKSYQTGKAWIPFYFGPDTMRMDEFYKGVGTVTYAGAGVGGVHWKVYHAVYNTNEDGYPDN